ncbi:thrombospondin type 3 repeat-containing protein [Streptobacillus moniliformis]|uniref:Uncharacterized protein n=1 Tax=Streptobacillus moniliformis (strain ATCC 14647 / DSM 12112 / NCTC 10651 / 9901) TaxID=519441 RepID=D1AYG7_STRM9|nr:thrombospondin type 3 repeat-containing protein [Streptobacillus moniliformis]ACZ01343.1 hypothetical protein Smon_0876 [Streptobacillus moniliformis DSM 12112]AVL43639.1 hypothetical protein CEP89_07465 [Streptobacillus moniliformis]SQA13498.1 Uncharacterised protein [Streptobacillus moniliformis]
MREVRNRNFMNASLFERADALATIRNKKVQDVKTEDFINILYAFLERLEALRDNISNNSIEHKESKKAIEEVIETLEKVIENQTQKIEKEINQELLRDSDGDGLNDYEEIRRGLDPFDRDTDRDGINDRDDVFLDDFEKEKLIEKY